MEQKKTITENYNQSKCRDVELSPNGYIYRTNTLKAQQSEEEMVGNY